MNAEGTSAQRRFIADLVERHYELRVRSLRLLIDIPEKQVWRVEGVSGAAIVLRAHRHPAAPAMLRQQATILKALAARQFPAERLVPTDQGGSIVVAAPWTTLATTAIAGTPAAPTVEGFRALGACIGQLHAIEPTALPGGRPTLGAAAMLPAREIAWVAGELARIEGGIEAARREEYRWLRAALAALDRCDDLPEVLIHNDCHPGNAIVTPDGDTTLVDWEGAGLGPAIIDLGFLLSATVSAAPWLPSFPPDPARVAAIVAGYRRYRHPTTAELDRLAGAIRFRALIFGVADFARRVAAGLPAGEGWWRARYDAAEPIARHVRSLCVPEGAQG